MNKISDSLYLALALTPSLSLPLSLLTNPSKETDVKKEEKQRLCQSHDTNAHNRLHLFLCEEREHQTLWLRNTSRPR